MNPRRRALRVLAITLTVCLVQIGSGRAEATPQSDAVEVRLLELINGGRAGVGKAAEKMHAGLRSMARGHSTDQGADDRLSHDGFDDRVKGAAPDPPESNGSPDDGFSARCENVAVYQPGSGNAGVEQVAQSLYKVWYDSDPHRDCMFDAENKGYNVVGVGIHFRSSSGKWWATFESVRDATPPKAQPKPRRSWKRVEDTSPDVSYSQTWPVEVGPLQTWPAYDSKAASGGGYRQSTSSGAYARFAFKGTGVRWIGTKWANGGIATVKIDGKAAGSVDQFSSKAAWRTVLFERTGLRLGSHTLEIGVKGTNNPNATDARTVVDAFERS